MFLQKNQQKSSQSSPRQSQSSCESSTERMNKAQISHQKRNPYSDGNNYKINNFLIQDNHIEGDDQENKYKKNVSLGQQSDHKQNTGVNREKNDRENDEVKILDSSQKKSNGQLSSQQIYKKASASDIKIQIGDNPSIFMNNNIFLDEEMEIKCTKMMIDQSKNQTFLNFQQYKGQIFQRKDEFEESNNNIQQFNIHSKLQQPNIKIINNEQSSPIIKGGKIKENNDYSPKNPFDQIGRQIFSEYLPQQKDSINISNGQGLGIKCFPYTNSIYSNNSSDYQSSIQTIPNNLSQTIKPNQKNDSLNSINSVQLNSLDNSKGSTNQSIKKMFS